MANKPTDIPPGYKAIFCASYFNKKQGKRISASKYGKKAFRFVVPIGKKS